MTHMSYILFVSIVCFIFSLDFDFRNLTLTISYKKQHLISTNGERYFGQSGSSGHCSSI